MLNDVMKQVKRYWMPDKIIRSLSKLELSTYDFAVYAYFCSRADKSGASFPGVRRIANDLGISKTTVQESVTKLEAYRLLVRINNPKKGEVCHRRVGTVSYRYEKPCQPVVPKEYNKELIKEEDKICKSKKVNPKEILKKLNPEAYKKLYGYTP